MLFDVVRKAKGLDMSQITRIATMVAVGVVLAGCSSSKDKAAWEDPFFPADDITPPSRVMADRQAANGAAADGMLFDIHFDGGELNSLGMQKLDLMAKGRSPHTPMKVYLNMPKDADTTAPRQSAVEKALETAGIATDKYVLAVGPNPGVLMPADAGFRALAEPGDARGEVTPGAVGMESTR
jgi:hypothetical protein